MSGLAKAVEKYTDSLYHRAVSFDSGASSWSSGSERERMMCRVMVSPCSLTNISIESAMVESSSTWGVYKAQL